MPRANIYLSKEENDIVNSYHETWRISKEETIEKIIKDFREEN